MLKLVFPLRRKVHKGFFCVFSGFVGCINSLYSASRGFPTNEQCSQRIFLSALCVFEGYIISH